MSMVNPVKAINKTLNVIPVRKLHQITTKTKVCNPFGTSVLKVQHLLMISRGMRMKKIKHQEIPEEFSSLTISELPLICKSAPYIPSVHLRNGFYALQDQCVVFPQNMTPVCTDLPRHPNQMVTYICQLGNSETSSLHLQHLKVRRIKAIEALKWLKIHHTEYKDITFNRSKLDWMHHKHKEFVLDQ